MGSFFEASGDKPERACQGQVNVSFMHRHNLASTV